MKDNDAINEKIANLEDIKPPEDKPDSISLFDQVLNKVQNKKSN